MDITIQDAKENTEIIVFDAQRAQEELEKQYAAAQKMLKDEDEIERLLQRLEKKLKEIRLVGDKLAVVPIMISLVRSYVKKEYTDVPIGSIVAIVSALIYVVSPVDIIPDSVPVLGYFDDATMVAFCWQLVESDVKEYQAWRQKNDKILDV